MFVIGVTGGIATGKTAFTCFLKNMGALVIDADKISRTVIVKPKISKAIISEIDEDILDSEGNIDRRSLGRLVFADRRKLDLLNNLMLPAICDIVSQDLELFSKTTTPNQIVAIDAPLLIESDLFKLVDLIVLVKSETKTRLERAEEKGFTIEEAQNIIGSQLSEEKKEDFADYIIENNGTLDDLKDKAADLWQEVMRMAAF